MSEHQLQIAVAHMLTVVLDPERTWFSAIDHAAKLSKRYGGERKRRGVKPGIPDFIVMWMDDNLIGIELKTAKGTVSPAQSDVATSWTLMGFGVFVARSLEEVQEILEFCRVPMLRRMNFLGGGHEHPGRAARPRYPRAQRQRKSKAAVPLVQQRP